MSVEPTMVIKGNSVSTVLISDVTWSRLTNHHNVVTRPVPGSVPMIVIVSVCITMLVLAIVTALIVINSDM